jgi:hypothetical protein
MLLLASNRVPRSVSSGNGEFFNKYCWNFFSQYAEFFLKVIMAFFITHQRADRAAAYAWSCFGNAYSPADVSLKWAWALSYGAVWV